MRLTLPTLTLFVGLAVARDGAAADSLRVLSGDRIDPLGALVIAPELNELTVFSGAEELSGSFLDVDCEDCSIWRPDDPFEEGAVIALDSSEYGGATLRVETEATALLSRVFLEFEEELSMSLDSICCPQDGVAYGPAPVGTPDPPKGDPRCPTTLLGPGLQLSLSVSDGRGGQVLLKVDSWPAGEEGPSKFFLSQQFSGVPLVSPDGAGGASSLPEEVCVKGESWDLITGEKNDFALCEKVPALSLEPEEQEPVFSQIRECPLPPEGFKSSWCSGMNDECRLLADRLIGFEQTAQVSSCANFYELCNVDAPGGVNSSRAPEPSCGYVFPHVSQHVPRPGKLFGLLWVVVAALYSRRRRYQG